MSKDCYKCPDRTATCHATCGDYLEKFNKRAAELEEKAKHYVYPYTAAEERRHRDSVKSKAMPRSRRK